MATPAIAETWVCEGLRLRVLLCSGAIEKSVKFRHDFKSKGDFLDAKCPEGYFMYYKTIEL